MSFLIRFILHVFFFFFRLHSTAHKISHCTQDIFSKFKNFTCKNLLQTLSPKIISISSFKVSMLHAKFYMIQSNRIREETFTIILGKREEQRPLLIYMYPNCIIVLYIYIYVLSINFWAISCTRKPDQLILKIPQKV